MSKNSQDNLKNPAQPVLLVHPNFTEPFRSIRDAARWLGGDVLGLEKQYISVEVLNFLRKTGLTLSGEHELNGLRVLDRQSYAPQEPLLPSISQTPYVPHIPQNSNTSVDRDEEVCRQKDILLKTEETSSVDREIDSITEARNKLISSQIPITEFRIMESSIKNTLLQKYGNKLIIFYKQQNNVSMVSELLTEMEKLKLEVIIP